MGSDTAIVTKFVVCDSVIEDPIAGEAIAQGIWKRKIVKAFPFRSELTVMAKFRGVLKPTSFSIAILKALTREQVSRSVVKVKRRGKNQTLRSWHASATVEFPVAGQYIAKVDADGISPASYEFELVAG